MKVLLFKIFHNIFPTNILLSKYKIKDTNKCLCGNTDYIDHYFVNCPLIKEYWRGVKNHIFSFTNYNLPESTHIKLFGLDCSDLNNNLQQSVVNDINYILLIAKAAISKAKYFNSTNYSMYFENELSIRKKYFNYNHDNTVSNETID